MRSPEELDLELSNIIRDYENFKYKKELYELFNIPAIHSINAQILNNNNFKKVVMPLYNWIAKLKVISPQTLQNVGMFIMNYQGTPIINITNIADDIVIPSNITNLHIDKDVLYRSSKLKLMNPRSLYIIDNKTLYDAVTFCTYNKDIKLCTYIEKKVTQEMIRVSKLIKNEIKNKKPANWDKLAMTESLSNMIQIVEQTNSILEYHSQTVEINYKDYNTNNERINTLWKHINFVETIMIWVEDSKILSSLCNSISNQAKILAEAG